MDLKQLQAMGAYASPSLVKRDVPIRVPPLKPADQWEDPNTPEADELAPKEQWADDTLTVYIRKRSSVDFYELICAENREKPFVVIHRCVCNANGEPVFSDLKDVVRLKEWVWMPLAAVANEVNQFAPKNSKPRTSSGANSRSPSADEASVSGSRKSRKKSAPSGSRTETAAAG